MSHDPIFSYLQVLDSINEMRQSIAAEVGGGWTGVAEDVAAWETPADRWFEDCEFDPRAVSEE
jgi:hypothetical protein